jgi:type IV pilus assembly protein PilE
MRGFTLLELMIVVTVLAILVAIAIPTYSQYVTRSNRVDARVELEKVAQELERCFTLNSAFDHEDCSVTLPRMTENGVYQITGALQQASFVLTATPQGAQATRDTLCAALTLTNAGVRDATGTGGRADCW